jgi:hypothetical protein
MGTDVGVVAAEVEGDVDVEDAEVGAAGCGHDALAVPASAASTPQMVTGSVTPVPGFPGLPIGTDVEPAPVQVPLAFPLSAAVTAQAVTGTLTGTFPVGVVARCDGSHEFVALPATATTTLHALIGTTPSIGAPWLTLLVGRSLTSGKPALGMHIPVAVPYTSAMTPQTVAGELALLGHRVGLLRAIRRAVAVNLHDHVTDRDRHRGVDHALLRGRSIGAGRVAVA